MKKIFAVLLTLALALSLAACGKKSGEPAQAAPDLNQYFEDFMSSLGEENTPAMMDLEGQFLDAAYPGLSELQTRQCVVKAAAISSVPYEFALAELESEADAKAAAEIFQARIDSHPGQCGRFDLRKHGAGRGGGRLPRTVSIRTCIHRRGMPDGRGILPARKAKNRRNTWCISRFFNAAGRQKTRPDGVQRL